MIHPGRVATKITRFTGIPPDKSAQNIISIIDSLNFERTGHFLNADNGKNLPG